jgi:phosphoserine phosphatase
MKLCVFDFDSTLMDGETIDMLAKPLGLEEKVADITERAMSGELDFFESLTTRVALLKGLDVETVNDICTHLPFMPGAEETVKALKERGYTVICFSGGFRNATGDFKKKLGMDADFSNVLHAKDGKLTGLVGGDMMFDFSKGDMLERIQNILGIEQKDTMVVGDGANDKSMFRYAQKRVAFCARPVLKEAANIIIEEKDLTKILHYV